MWIGSGLLTTRQWNLRITRSCHYEAGYSQRKAVMGWMFNALRAGM
jgi:hypothetical protein